MERAILKEKNIIFDRLKKYVVFALLGFEIIIFYLGYFKNKGVLLILGSGGLAVATVLFFYPVIGAYLSILLVYTSVSAQFAGGLFKVVVLFTLAVYLIHLIYHNKGFESNYLFNLFLLFSGFVIISMPFAHNMKWAFEAFFEFFKAFVLMFILFNLFTKEKHLIYAAWVIVISATFVSLYGYYEILQNPAGFLIRTRGVAGDPNNMAIRLVTAVPFAYMLFKIEKNKVLRSVAVIFGLFIIAGIPPTFSRGGLLALSFVLLAILYKERHKKWVLILMVLLFSIFVYFLITNLGKGADLLGKRITSIDKSLLQRYRILIGGIKMFYDHPIFGVGLGNYLVYATRYSGVAIPLYAHNMFLHVGAELGVFAFSVFVFIFIVSFKRLAKIEKSAFNTGNELLAYLSRGVFISLLGFMIGGLFLSHHFSRILWTIFGLVMAVDLVYKRKYELSQ